MSSRVKEKTPRSADRYPRSWYAVYRSNDPRKCLIGAVYQSQTSRYASRQDAERRLADTCQLNGPHCVGEIHPSDNYPEIFAHCGRTATCIGAKCPDCGRPLTVEMAKAHIEPRS